MVNGIFECELKLQFVLRYESPTNILLSKTEIEKIQSRYDEKYHAPNGLFVTGYVSVVNDRVEIH